MPTRGRRITLTGLLPTVASIPMSAALSTRPRSSTRSPRFMSSPRGRTKSPSPTRRGTSSAPASSLTSSWGMTASAPSGSGAPVKIRKASPARSGRSAIAPAGTRPASAEARGRAGRRGGGVGAAERVAVHRGGRPRRHVARAVHVLGEHAVQALGERDPLVAEHGHARQDAFERFLDGDHARYSTAGA